ncbi:hypothetical protein HYZ76_01355 [Candidatus Falkowbacteria bacterium]|nr:hypothetical protein [Candidatus Falkowbacteria bacterium]
MNTLKNKICFGLLAVFIISLSFSLAAPADAALLQNTIDGLKEAVNKAYGGGEEVALSADPSKDPFMGTLIGAINLLLGFTGFLFLLLLIYAGWLWMFARGNEEQVSKAKKITREVIIGLIIILLARLSTELILYAIGESI